MGTRVRASPATQAKTLPSHHWAALRASSSRVVVPASAPSRVSQVTSTPSGRGRSWMWEAWATSMKTWPRWPAGQRSSQWPMAGRAVSSPATRVQSTPWGWPAEDLGPAIHRGSPGLALRAQAVAGPTPCWTKSTSSSPARGSQRRTV